MLGGGGGGFEGDFSKEKGTMSMQLLSLECFAEVTLQIAQLMIPLITFS